MVRDTADDGYRLSSEFYDHIPMYSGRDDVPFYSDLAMESGGPVLELGCGTGRILIPIARAGIDITGLDISQGMLSICEHSLSSESDDVRSRVTLVKCDMTAFSLGKRFPLVTVPFRAFQHLLTVEEQLSCLERVMEHISPGGTFVLDLFNPAMEYILDRSRRHEYGEEAPFMMPDGRRVTRRFRTSSVDLSRQVMECEIIYHVEKPDGFRETEVHRFSLRYLFRYEAEHLLERAGFRVKEVLGDFRGSPFGERWPGELILMAMPG